MRYIRHLALFLTAFSAITLEAGPPQFWRIETAPDLLNGTTEGLSIDESGALELGPTARLIGESDAARLWSVARAGQELFLGGGDEGRVQRALSGGIDTLFDAAELEIYALAAGPDNRIYAGSSPDGKVYAIDREGKAETFYDPEDRYIWSMCFDPRGGLWIASGLSGRLHRVERGGRAEIAFATPSAHVTALACAANGTVYAGTAPEGVVYRLDSSGRITVLYDSDFEEVKALQPRTDGSVIAAFVRQSEKEFAPVGQPAQSASQAGAGPAGQVIVTESVAVIAQPPGTLPGVAPGAPAYKGAVMLLSASGDVDTLWKSTEETPQSLAANDDSVTLGTGDKGRLYRIQYDRRWTMMARLPVEHITGLLAEDGGRRHIAITSNPSRIFVIEHTPVAEGTFTAAVKDAQAPALWGHIAWNSDQTQNGSVAVSTRSGNTESPDGTWSEWSPPYARQEGEKVTSPAARFLQVQVKMRGTNGARPRLHGVNVAYLQRNLRPEITSLEVYPAGEVFQKMPTVSGDIDILGLDARLPLEASTAQSPMPMQPAPFSRRILRRGLRTFSWQATDPNGDTLVYDIEYRQTGGKLYRPLRQGLSETVFAWDTTSVPNGRYILRVVARDLLSNTEALALDGRRESPPFDIDNTPPQIKAVIAQGLRSPVRIVARDEDSVLARAEYAVNGSEWRMIHPSDGINDEREETYDFTPAGLTENGANVVVVRVTDLLGNSSSARVDLPQH